MSHDFEIGGLQNDLTIVTGLLTTLRSDRHYSSAECLGVFVDVSQAVDGRAAPALGDGYYYLVDGRCATGSGFGDSYLTPDPRDSIAVCP